MGCSTSKLDDSPAVALCRDRCAFLDEAVRQRFAFAEAHAAYLHSLHAVGVSLHRFFNHDLDPSTLVPSSPLLNLPPLRKGDSPRELQHHLHSPSPSDSGSHLHFHSDDAPDSLHHHDGNSPQKSFGCYLPDYGNTNFDLPGAGGFMNISYMKTQTTPSVVHTQLPTSPETMHIVESSANSSYPYPNDNFSGYSNYGAGAIFGGSSRSAPNAGGFSSAPGVASTSKSPPPPPSPPQGSTWDFLNPFETYEKYYPAYTPSNDSREVREEEGIPDLEDEDEDVDDGVVKDVHVNKKLVDSRRSNNDAELQHTVYKDAGDAEEKSKDRGTATEFKPRGGFKDDLEVVKEIQVQFELASESGNDLAKFLEVGKLQYKRKNSSHCVSSKILYLPLLSSQPTTSRSSDNADPAFLDIHQDMELMSKNLSATLHKLYLWEEKLYEEVKVEEKIRGVHEQNSQKMKRMDERGSEAQKVDAIRTLVMDLSTKIKIAIQVVNKISVKINRLRDEELWPQLNEFIQGLTRMWKSMVKCHRNQCRAIEEAKQLDAITFHKHSTADSDFEATRQLQHDLINWTLWFSHWIDAQKCYVRALNNWLMKCVLYIPEETPDGIAPFSPGRIGAPPVFVVCHQWSQSLDRISEKEVVDSMRGLASNVLQLWERDKMEMRQSMLSKKERRIKSLEKGDHKVRKEMQALDKRMAQLSAANKDGPLTGHPVYQSETTKGESLQASLQHVLGAMGQFTANSLKIYEELLQRIEDDHLARENDR